MFMTRSLEPYSPGRVSAKEGAYGRRGRKGETLEGPYRKPFRSQLLPVSTVIFDAEVKDPMRCSEGKIHSKGRLGVSEQEEPRAVSWKTLV